MKSNVIRLSLLGAVFLFALDLSAAQEKKKDAKPFVSVIQKDGKKVQRRCFKDADKNGFCDNGSEQKWKCPNNCRAANIDEKKSDKKSKEKSDKKSEESRKKLKKRTGDRSWENSSPCSGCPLAGNCTEGCLAMLKK